MTPGRHRTALQLALAAYVTGLAVHVLPDGGPQPADLALVLLGGLAWAWRGPAQPLPAGPARWLLLLAVWAAVVDLGHALVLRDASFATGPLPWLHATAAVAILTSVAQILGVDKALRVTTHAVLAGLVITALAAALLVPRAGLRPPALFHNPSQFGYFTLCCAAVVSLARARRAVGPVVHAVGLGASALLTAWSTSRAAQAGLVLLLLLEPLRTVRGALTLLGLLAMGLAVPPLRDEVLRLNAHGQAQVPEHLAILPTERGLERLWTQPWHFLLGAGAGGHARFVAADVRPAEVHNSLMHLAFSYGLPGLLLAGLAVAALARGQGGLAAMTLAPVLVYGLVHNGTRFRAFWLVVALVAAVRPVRASPASSRPEGLA